MLGNFKYLFFKRIVQGVLKIYYRTIETYGQNFFPTTGRTLLIANHQSGLPDGLLILGTSPQVVRTVAKHTLWKTWIIRIFANGLGMIPVYRKQDMSEKEQSSVDPNRNDRSYSAVEKALVDGDNVLIFPEGVSHDNPHILRLRSGAARMLLATEAKFDFKLGINWMPASIDYDYKDRPGSQAHVHYHPARSLAGYRESYARDVEATVEALRVEMQNYLAIITLNFKTWEDREFVERLTQIWLAMAPNELFRDHHNLLLKWKRVLEMTGSEREHLADWDSLRSKVHAVYNSLALGGLQPEEVFERQREGRKRAVAKLFSATMLWAPIVLVGLVFYYLPNRVVGLVTRKGAGPYRDVVSTYQIVGALVLYPAWILLCTFTLGYFTNFWFGMGFFLLVVSAGLSLASAARYLRVEFFEVFNMYRYKKLEDRLDYLESEIRVIWAQAAKLWNLALKREAALDADEPLAVGSATP